jgi:hypothetical protein
LNILTGFQIKGIDVAHPTSHVEKNNVGRRLRSFRGNFIAESLGSKAPSYHRSKADPEESLGGVSKEFATREFVAQVLRREVH